MQIAGAIYGSLAVGTLLAVESARQETYGETLGAVVIALLLYWLAHSYAEFTSRRIREGERLTLRGLTGSMALWSPIPVGAGPPLIALVMAHTLGANLTVAVSVGFWTAVGSIVLVELFAAARSRSSILELLLQSSMGALLGIGIIALRIVLH